MMYALVLVLFGNSPYTPVEYIEVKHSMTYSQCNKSMHELNKKVQGEKVKFSCSSYRLH